MSEEKEINNLELWDSVSKTNTKFTKQAKKGQHHFTSITPVYQFKMATEAFGVQGLGWGVEVGSEHFEEKEYGTTIILSYDAILFFNYKGERGRIPIHASEKSCYQTQGASGYMKIDDEVRKKVVTNAKTKGLSELGFNADIFMGMFDDPEYVEYIVAEQEINNAENKEDAINKKNDELNDWCKKEIEIYKITPNKRGIELSLVRHKQKIQNKCKLINKNPEPYYKKFEESAKEAIEQLKPKDEK